MKADRIVLPALEVPWSLIRPRAVADRIVLPGIFVPWSLVRPQAEASRIVLPAISVPVLQVKPQVMAGPIVLPALEVPWSQVRPQVRADGMVLPGSSVPWSLLRPQVKAGGMVLPGSSVPWSLISPQVKASRIVLPAISVPVLQEKPQVKASRVVLPGASVPWSLVQPQVKASRITLPGSSVPWSLVGPRVEASRITLPGSSVPQSLISPQVTAGPITLPGGGAGTGVSETGMTPRVEAGPIVLSSDGSVTGVSAIGLNPQVTADGIELPPHVSIESTNVNIKRVVRVLADAEFLTRELTMEAADNPTPHVSPPGSIAWNQTPQDQLIINISFTRVRRDTQNRRIRQPNRNVYYDIQQQRGDGAWTDVATHVQPLGLSVRIGSGRYRWRVRATADGYLDSYWTYSKAVNIPRNIMLPESTEATVVRVLDLESLPAIVMPTRELTAEADDSVTPDPTANRRDIELKDSARATIVRELDLEDDLPVVLTRALSVEVIDKDPVIDVIDNAREIELEDSTRATVVRVVRVEDPPVQVPVRTLGVRAGDSVVPDPVPNRRDIELEDSTEAIVVRELEVEMLPAVVLTRALGIRSGDSVDPVPMANVRHIELPDEVRATILRDLDLEADDAFELARALGVGSGDSVTPDPVANRRDIEIKDSTEAVVTRTLDLEDDTPFELVREILVFPLGVSDIDPTANRQDIELKDSARATIVRELDLEEDDAFELTRALGVRSGDAAVPTTVKNRQDIELKDPAGITVRRELDLEADDAFELTRALGVRSGDAITSKGKPNTPVEFTLTDEDGSVTYNDGDAREITADGSAQFRSASYTPANISFTSKSSSRVALTPIEPFFFEGIGWIMNFISFSANETLIVEITGSAPGYQPVTKSIIVNIGRRARIIRLRDSTRATITRALDVATLSNVEVPTRVLGVGSGDKVTPDPTMNARDIDLPDSTGVFVTRLLRTESNPVKLLRVLGVGAGDSVDPRDTLRSRDIDLKDSATADVVRVLEVEGGQVPKQKDISDSTRATIVRRMAVEVETVELARALSVGVDDGVEPTIVSRIPQAEFTVRQGNTVFKDEDSVSLTLDSLPISFFVEDLVPTLNAGADIAVTSSSTRVAEVTQVTDLPTQNRTFVRVAKMAAGPASITFTISATGYRPQSLTVNLFIGVPVRTRLFKDIYDSMSAAIERKLDVIDLTPVSYTIQRGSDILTDGSEVSVEADESVIISLGDLDPVGINTTFKVTSSDTTVATIFGPNLARTVWLFNIQGVAAGTSTITITGMATGRESVTRTLKAIVTPSGDVGIDLRESTDAAITRVLEQEPGDDMQQDLADSAGATVIRTMAILDQTGVKALPPTNFTATLRP
ncbi:hypothetical protein [Candidatus Poriferisocius sp.]|uniref:hypothetical protein n=1 Tax=Candidatus Poriferisocius sp. TaxID=3101276 RepID=UPI003B529940